MPGTADPHAGDTQSESASSRQSSTSAANPYRKIALDLQRQLDAVRYSRAWQLTLACGLALRSFREALRLPGRVWRILSRPPGPPDADLAAPQAHRPPAERRSKLAGWPAERPLVSAVILCAGEPAAVMESLASLRSSTLQDFEVLVLQRPGDDVAGLRESFGDAGRPRILEVECADSAVGRNRAVEAAEGKYVVLLRGGDCLDPTFLEKAAWALEQDSGLGFAYAWLSPAGPERFGGVETFSLDRARRYNPVADSALFRREAWLEAGGFRAETKLDLWDFWVALGTLGWSGFLCREELVRPGAESLRAQARLRDVTREPAEAEKMRQRHALLEASPVAAPSAGSQAASATAASAGRRNQTVGFPQRRFLEFGADKPAILCVVPWLDIGGAEQVVLQIMRGLSDRFSFAVVATLAAENNRAAEFREATPWVYHLPESSAADPGRFLGDLAAMHGVRGVLISSSEAGYRALPALKQRGLWTADIVHNTAAEGYLDQSIGCDGYLDVHFACGRLQADALRHAAGISESRIRTVWTSVDATGRFDLRRYEAHREALRAEFGLESRDVVLAYVGRLSVEKDVPLFVAAVSQIVRRNSGVRIRALAAGDGPELLRVEQAIEREGVWNEVRLLGDSRRVPEILAVSDYMLLTSRTEGSPLTILEAMSLKVVVLSTAVGNVGEVIDNGVNGFVVEGRDPAVFADRFEELGRDPEREKRMREAARRTILERFDEPQMLEGYAEVFRAALGPGRGNRSV